MTKAPDIADDLSTVLKLKGSMQINEWVQHFLRSGEGRNVKLADKLTQHGEYVVGPIEYPIQDLANILGPDDSYLFYEDPETLTMRVDSMSDSIAKGWKPAPLIVTDIWKDHFEIADGSHRQRALLAAGYRHYYVIFYFRDAARMSKFLKC
jgi:hypothetical protein